MLNGKEFRVRCASMALAGVSLLALSAQRSLAQNVTLTPEAAAAQSTGGALPTVEVVATTPLGTGTSALNVPSETQIITGEEIGDLNQQTLQDALARRTPGVSVTDSQGSPLYESVDFRGESATPVPGTPEGLAVYMNGVRINESYGDVVNWNLIPPSAIDNAQIVTGNPVFGLNALAGAVVMKMKNGFTWQGTEINLQGGMDYTAQGYAEYGITKGNWAYYVDIDGITTNGFRYFGQSDAGRAYGDIGYRAEGNEVHLSMTGGAAGVGIAGTTALQLEQEDPWAVFTTPQTTRNAAEMISLTDESHITPNLTFNGNVYFRNYASTHHDGNISDFYSCADPGGYACNSNDIDPTTGINTVGPLSPGNTSAAAGTTPLRDPLGGTAPDGTPLGETDSNFVHSLSTGATGELTDTDRILGHANTITAGVSIDHGWSHFIGSSILSTLPPDFVVPWTDEIIDEPGYDVAPTDVRAQNTYLGVYVLDNFNITDRLTLHAGARFNDAWINLTNALGGPAAAVSQSFGTYPLLNSSNNFNRINPVAGLSYLITPEISVYGSYSEANRAPTPLELGCSSPQLPCQIDNFLVADPPLQQIVSRTFEAGFKGSNAIAWAWAPGRLDWSVAGYHTVNYNDIYSVPSPDVVGLGYYSNAGDTLREGVDIGATYTTDRWDAYASYSYIKAEFLTPTSLSSPNNPTADANGFIQVEPGDNLPGIPNHKFKFGIDYEVLPGWKVGGDVVYHSSQYYFGAENNTITPAGGPYYNPQVSGYTTLDLRTSYQVTKNIQIYGLINNALDYRGASYGILYSPGDIENQTTGACLPGYFCPNGDPRAITVAPPVEAFVGLKVAFDAPPPAPALLAKY
jgi:iron complex outermembrane recepter protein